MPRDQNAAEPLHGVSLDGRVFDREGAFAEYQARAQGIATTDTGIIQFTGIIVAAIGGITAAGITVQNQYVFLVTFGLLIIANLYITEKRWVIWLHAAYIRKYLENDRTGIWWETRLAELRKGMKSPVGGIKWVEMWMFIIIGFIEALLFFWYERALLVEDFIGKNSIPLTPFTFGHYSVLLKHVLPICLLVLLVWLAARNYIALRTKNAENDIIAALPGVNRLSLGKFR